MYYFMTEAVADQTLYVAWGYHGILGQGRRGVSGEEGADVDAE